VRVSDYDKFVQQTDQSADLEYLDRKEIAIYGLTAEIGSIASAIKKKLLNEDGTGEWGFATSEIEEELGDAMWYCFALARIANRTKPVNILTHDVKNLIKELSASNDRSDKIRVLIGNENHETFLSAAKSFHRGTRKMTFNDYQSITALTARTEKRALAGVCVAVLYQLSAEILRDLLPPMERDLNRSLRDRPLNDILSDTAWHLAALASAFNLDLSAIAQRNIDKVSYRGNRNHPVIVHDRKFPQQEQFPRRFEISFISRSKDRAQMYFQGRQLGDTLTDNSYEDDGYRFHDVMHLSNIAHLGWSPVVRSLMGRKRKSIQKVDEIEDGARAKIVEEAVIKAIHSEGKQLARPASSVTNPARLFPTRSHISFKFLKFIQTLVDGLEVSKNRHWEWEDSIYEGYAIYHLLRERGQGTVTVDLDARSLTYHPDVFVQISGRVAGIGTAQSVITQLGTTEDAKQSSSNAARHLGKKKAILASIGLDPEDSSIQASLELTEREDGAISFRASGNTQEAIWRREIISFQATAIKSESTWICNALALTDT